MFMGTTITPFGEPFNTTQGIHHAVKTGCNIEMDIKELRQRRLAALIKDRFGDNAAAFARAIDRSSSQVNDMLSGRKSFGEKVARYIENKLNLTDGWFDAEDLQVHSIKSLFSNAKPVRPLGYTIPLISWVSAGLFCEAIDLFQPGVAEDWLPCSKKYGPHAYALRVDGDSMVSPYPGMRSYPPGYIIFVDPDRPVENGSRVIAKIHDSNEATFKVYAEDGGKRWLKPLNPQYPTIELVDGMILCGVVVGGTWEE